MSAYYNEIDPFAAEWLRELIKQGHIADGVVDERSIEDVTPDDLRGFTQCHFFAGIGVWSHALRQAGWPDDRPVWTGSCPCQPFSSAGNRKGFDDERHLWPALYWLIAQCRPDVVFGEQVAGKAGQTWIDLVSSDLEGQGYACGIASTVACGFGSPHKRQRLYWVADSDIQGSQGRSIEGNCPNERSVGKAGVGGGSGANTLADSTCMCRKQERRNTSCDRTSSRKETGVGYSNGSPNGGDIGMDFTPHPGPTNGYWRDADWLYCVDGKWRCVEPSTFPLANGTPGRVGLLRGYGNAIVGPQAQAFIEAYLEAA